MRIGDFYSDAPVDISATEEGLPQPAAASRTSFLTADGQTVTPLEQAVVPGTGGRLEIAFIDKCRIVRECIGRVRVDSSGRRAWATGFLIAPGLLMTNHHVVPDVASAQKSHVEFGYWYDLAGQLSRAEGASLSPMDFYVSDPVLDYAVVAVQPTSGPDDAVTSRGFLRLIPETGKIRPGELATILHHPDGAPMQVALRNNKIRRAEPGEAFIEYASDTGYGSSGAPVFNDSFQLVALHTGGRIRQRRRQYALINGTFADSLDGLGEADVIWEFQIGARVSRICMSLLEQARANFPGRVHEIETAMRGGGDVLSGAIFEAKFPSPQAPYPAPEGIGGKGVPLAPMRAQGALPAGTAASVTIPIQLRVTVEVANATAAQVPPTEEEAPPLVPENAVRDRAPKSRGLRDVVDLALSKDRGAGRRYGAAGAGPGADRELDGEYESARSPGSPAAPDTASLSDPISRMFATTTGRSAAARIGNETRTIAAFDQLGAEIIAEALVLSNQVQSSDRLLITRKANGDVPVLLILSDRIQDVGDSRVISDEVQLPLDLMKRAVEAAPSQPAAGVPELMVLETARSHGAAGIADTMIISRPEIVLTRLPRMVPICVPQPGKAVMFGEMISTAGILCCDAEGTLGVTACFHGTGPVGTKVKIGGRECVVKRASELQDLVFIPVDKDFTYLGLRGRGGLRGQGDLAPAEGDSAWFDGATNANTETWVQSVDRSIFRNAPGTQLRFQTDRDTDHGDSGSALLDSQDRILGFAHRMTDYGEHPEFADWVWAPNALRALGLTPFVPERKEE